jgi:hypothetical protein
MSDDFPERLKRDLAARVGNLCSYPGCRASTSGPQDDPAKAVNVGVAAHITAASPGGPRYDPDLLPEERSGPENGIWLCQNHAKLIDNDPAQFGVDLLKKWKKDAEAEANDRIGKPAAYTIGCQAPLDLTIGTRFRIAPIIPRQHEQTDFLLIQDKAQCYSFSKVDSLGQIDIPQSFIEKVHRFGNSKPALIQLNGRLQWVSERQNFELFPDKPPPGSFGACYGVGKDVDLEYPQRLGIAGRFAREERLPLLLTQGWVVFYDLDGSYLRWPGHDVDQIFVCQQA